MSCRVVVVLPAAGYGERMGVSEAKQFCIVHGKPLICHAVDAFLLIPWVEKVIIVSSSDAKIKMLECVSGYKKSSNDRISVICGGPTRHKSILCGIEHIALAGKHPDIVVIHDGVRPLVPLQVLVDVVDAAKDHGAAGVVNPLVSTVVTADENGYLDKALDRFQHFASEMPQAFKFSIIENAYKKFDEIP